MFVADRFVDGMLVPYGNVPDYDRFVGPTYELEPCVHNPVASVRYGGDVLDRGVYLGSNGLQRRLQYWRMFVVEFEGLTSGGVL